MSRTNDDESLEELISRCLIDFYQRRKKNLDSLKLGGILRRKNPYLLRALGIEDPGQLIESMLESFLKEGDETIFGDSVFEEVAIWAAKKKGGRKSNASRVDIEIEDDRTIRAYAIKSSPNWGNSTQWAEQDRAFRELWNRRKGSGKEYDPVVGACTGTTVSPPTKNRVSRKVSGQVFWEELTDDSEFYLRFMRCMETKVHKAKREFELAREEALVRYKRQFQESFCKDDGSIDWDMLAQHNSGRSAKKRGDMVKSLTAFE